MQELQRKVMSIISEALGVPLAEVRLSSHLENDLGIDSLDKAELLMELEEEFGFQISEDSAQSVSTVAEVIEMIVANKT